MGKVLLLGNENRLSTPRFEEPCRIELYEFLQQELAKSFPSHFLPETNILPHYSQGVSNITFVVQDRYQRLWILRARYGDGLRFRKEQWILNNYSEEFPSAIPFTDGFVRTEFQDTPLSLFLQSYVAYPSAFHLKNLEDVSESLLAEVACTARLINECVVIGYGTHFVPGQNTFSELTWSSHIEKILNDMKLDEIAKTGQIPLSHIKAFEQRFLAMESLNPTPRLYHRDLLKNWGNILINKRNNIQAVIDWEHAGSGMGIPEEIATAIYVMHRDGLDPEKRKSELRQILLGYDITFREYLSNYHEYVELFLTQIAIEKMWYYQEIQKKQKVLSDWRKSCQQRAARLAAAKCKQFAS